MVTNFHEITKQFEQALCDYTGAKYCVAVDNASNGIYIALMYEKEVGNWNPIEQPISIPCRTYMSVPCEIINAGGMVNFLKKENDNGKLKGAYRLNPTRVIDSALRFTADMYEENTLTILSFTGAYKHFKLSKGGAILTDDEKAYNWLKKARNSGRGEMSYHDDNFTQIGINCYMMPEVASRGLVLFNQFYNADGSKKENQDLELPYPDLSKFSIYKRTSEVKQLHNYINYLQSKVQGEVLSFGEFTLFSSMIKNN